MVVCFGKHMCAKVNDTDLRVLALFTEDYSSSYYIREVQRLLGVSSRTALLALDRLEQLGVLTSNERGKIKLYGVARAPIAVQYMCMAEQYKSTQVHINSAHISSLLSSLQGCKIQVDYTKGFSARCQRIFVSGSIGSDTKRIAKTLGVTLEQKKSIEQGVLLGDVYSYVGVRLQ